VIAFAAAAGAIVGSLVALPLTVPYAVVAILGVLRSRSPIVVAVAMVVITSVMFGRATSGMTTVESAHFDGWVTLTDDPTPIGRAGVRFTIKIDGRRIDAAAHGSPAGPMGRVLAGERVWVRGELRPLDPGDSWNRWRHVVGRLAVDEVVAVGAAAPVSRIVNRVRRTLSSGAQALPSADRALFLGMVIGDDRGQLPVTADDFRAAGLGHLLVVSGQNVAFVLAIVAPSLARFRPGPRLAILLMLLAAFSLLTRFEPSVLRAVVMAGVSVGATALDLDIDGRKALSWAVAGLLVVDPFLVHVVAFRLSVAATAGLVWMSAPIAERLRGPKMFRVALATTVSAQLAVSPVLITTFGPMPLASLPANVLAEPFAGPVMMWGSTGGLVAGVLGGWPAQVIHLPTRALLWWISGVAGLAARAPAAMVGASALVILASALVLMLSGRFAMRSLGLAAMIGVVGMAVVGAPTVALGSSDLGEGTTVWHAGSTTVVVLDGPRNPRRTLEVLRLGGVREIDAVVARRGNRSDAAVVRSLYDRFGSLAVAAPPMHRVPGGHAVERGDTINLDDLRVEILDVDPQIDLRVSMVRPVFDSFRAVAGGGYGR